MSDPTLSAEQIIALDHGIEEWENHGGPVLNHLVPVVARMIAKAEQIGYGRGLTRDYGRGYERGRTEVTAAVEAAFDSLRGGAMVQDREAWRRGVVDARAHIHAVLADPAAHVAAIKAEAAAEALREAADAVPDKSVRFAVYDMTRVPPRVDYIAPDKWLRDRADRIGGAS